MQSFKILKFIRHDEGDHIKVDEVDSGFIMHGINDKFCTKVQLGYHTETNHLTRPRHVQEDNIKKHLKEIGCADLHWIQITQDRVY